MRRSTRRIEESGVACGEIGGKSDWKTEVRRDSRCLGTAGGEDEEEVEGGGAAGVVKLFMTRRGAVRYSLPAPRGRFMLFLMSLQRLYRSTRKWSVGPRGVRASRRLVLPELERENRRRCDTPSGPAMVM